MNRLSCNSWLAVCRPLVGLAMRMVGVALVGSWLGGGAGIVRADEPYERFLQKLRDERLFDLALVYLDELQGKTNLKPQFQADLELERGLLLYQAAATLPFSAPDRSRKLDAAETALREFLDARRQHPRRGEARMKLGELLLARAEEARQHVGSKAAQENAAQDNPEAIKFYDQAHQLFESTIAELAEILEGLKGARVDATDTTAVAYRQKIQQDIRQSQLLSAKSVEDRGRSRALSSPERTKDLQQALTMFSDLYTKELGMVAVRNYALFYRSGIQASLKKVDDAIDGYQRIADAEGVDFLRPLQANSVTELLKLLGEQKKFSVAIDRADKWLADLRPDERASAETLALKLELARQKIAWAEELRKKDPEDRVAGRLVRDTRNDLRGLLRTPGPHVEAAKELLGALGVEQEEAAPQELPAVKNFAEALAAAQERIERSETAGITWEAMGLEVADPQTTAERKQELTTQMQQTQQAIDGDQQQAIELLRSGLRLYQASDSREQLYDARFRLAFLLLKQQRPWESLAVGQFLTRTAAGSEKGLRAAAIALGSFRDLLRLASPETKAELTAQLQPFAQFLVATWPESSEAAAAASSLVQLALINKDYEQAEQYLSMVPAGGESTHQLRRSVGLAFYVRYQEELKAAGAEAASTKQLRQQALEQLQAGVTGVSGDAWDAGALDAVNVVARLLLAQGKLQEAAELFMKDAGSPLQTVEKNFAEKKQDAYPARVIMETYRTAIQLHIALLAEEQLPADQALAQIREKIQQLQSTATDAETRQALASMFVSLARDLKSQLADIRQETKRKKMSETLLVVAGEAAKSNSFDTEYWAADTIISIAEELQSAAGSKSQALAAYAEAAKILEAILAKEQSQPGWINPPELLPQIRLKLALTARGQGDFKNAIEQLATILDKNNGLLDVQIEAARTYQAWAAAGNSGFHRVAIEGGRPDPKTRKKLIWGWGKIQEMTANRPDFAEQFFEARYQLAYSRMQYALGLADPAAQQAELQRAVRDIESTAKLYPELGGPQMKQRFQTLLATIRKQIS